jgi:hypothetical protein
LAGTKIIDSRDLLCYLEQEPGYAAVGEVFEEAVGSSQPLHLCAVNWEKVYYQMARRAGDKEAQEKETHLC